MVKTEGTDVWQEYQRGLDYQEKMGFSTKWPENVRFVEGNQWPAATEKTKYMPRPVINQCDFIVENKQSNILSQSIKMVYSPEELPPDIDTTSLVQGADDYTDAAENTWNNIEQDTLNEDAVSDALILGTGVYHYYYDAAYKGGQFTQYVGRIQGEIIDPLDIVLGNPHLQTIQKQPYIIIRHRIDTTTLVEEVKKNKGDWQKIQADTDISEEKYDSAKQDMDGSQKTTVLTKYFKKNGEVYWSRSTKNVEIVKEQPLTPEGSPYNITLYPVEMLTFKKRRKCAFGRSIIEDIIPNQKALNWGLGMMLLSVQQTAWPKVIAKVGALMQGLTNEPGEIVVDHFGAQGIDGVKYMQPPNFSQMPMILTEKLMDMTRQVTGTTEVTSGEVIGANMAASAIIALQNQAKKPNENYQNKLFRSMKRVGRIWEEFYKAYYTLPRPIPGTDEEGNEITKQFVGADYADTSFGLQVDVGPASTFSESLQVTVLEKLFDKGALDKYQYIKYLPDNVVPQDLKQDFGKEAELMKQQQEQMQMQPQQGMDVDYLLNNLSEQELMALKAKPEILQQFMQNQGGGMNGLNGGV